MYADERDMRTQEAEINVDPDESKFVIRKGKALMISLNDYGKDHERCGNQYDKMKMSHLLNNLGFEITVVEDTKEKPVNIDDIYLVINKMSDDYNGYLEDVDGLVIVIMAHGTIDRFNNDCLIVNDQFFNMGYIYDRFSNNKCKSLAGKPKLILSQHCRGDAVDLGVIPNGRRISIKSDSVSFQCIPKMSEFFIANASFKGYKAFLDVNNGSWFIQEIVNVFFEKINEGWELHRMMIEVNRRIAKHSCLALDTNVYSCSKTDIVMECPCFQSSLTKEVYFMFKTKQSHRKLESELQAVSQMEKEGKLQDDQKFHERIRGEKNQTSNHELSCYDEKDTTLKKNEKHEIVEKQGNIKMAIQLENVCESLMEDDLNEILQILSEKIASCFLDEDSGPRFNDYSFHEGILHITLSNDRHKSWLIENMSGFSLSKGKRLKIEVIPDYEKHFKASILLPCTLKTKNSDEILQMINSQNKGLRTQNWKFVQKSANAALIYVIDEEIVQRLKENDFKCYCGIEQLKIEILDVHKQNSI